MALEPGKKLGVVDGVNELGKYHNGNGESGESDKLKFFVRGKFYQGHESERPPDVLGVKYFAGQDKCDEYDEGN